MKGRRSRSFFGALGVERPAVDLAGPAVVVPAHVLQPAIHEGRLPDAAEGDEGDDVGVGVSQAVEELEFGFAAEEVEAGVGSLAREIVGESARSLYTGWCFPPLSRDRASQETYGSWFSLGSQPVRGCLEMAATQHLERSTGMRRNSRPGVFDSVNAWWYSS